MENSSQVQEILNGFEYIADNRRTITLLSNYRGVAIEISAFVMRVSRVTRQVFLYVRQRQVIALKSDSQIFIKSDLFSRTILAQVQTVNLRSRLIVIKEMGFVSEPMGSRKSNRVQPAGQVPAVMVIGNGEDIQAEMIDISSSGISLKVPAPVMTDDHSWLPGTIIDVLVHLPGTNGHKPDPITLAARVSYINPENSREHTRIGLETFPKERDEMVIRRYIFDRQTSILKEIGTANSELLEGLLQTNRA